VYTVLCTDIHVTVFVALLYTTLYLYNYTALYALRYTVARHNLVCQYQCTHTYTHKHITYVCTWFSCCYRGVEVYHAGLLYHTVVLIWCTTQYSNCTSLQHCGTSNLVYTWVHHSTSILDALHVLYMFVWSCRGIVMVSKLIVILYQGYLSNTIAAIAIFIITLCNVLLNLS
jgi:hypothetical protein